MAGFAGLDGIFILVGLAALVCLAGQTGMAGQTGLPCLARCGRSFWSRF